MKVLASRHSCVIKFVINVDVPRVERWSTRGTSTLITNFITQECLDASTFIGYICYPPFSFVPSTLHSDKVWKPTRCTSGMNESFCMFAGTRDPNLTKSMDPYLVGTPHCFKEKKIKIIH